MSEPAASSPTQPSSPFQGFRVVSLLTLASRVLGMFRDIVMAAAFGAGPVMDAFSVAFRIPNMARRLFGEGAQTAAFLPAFVRTHDREGLAAAQKLSSAMFWSLAAILSAAVVLSEGGLLAVRWLVPLSTDARLLVDLLLLLTPYVIFICLAAQLSAALHGLRAFLWPAMLPIVLNGIWLVTLPLVFLGFQDESLRMRALCSVIVAAGVVQLGILIVVLRRRGLPLTKWSAEQRPLVRSVYGAMTPILLGVIVTQINSLADSLLAWGLTPGTGAAPRTGLWSWLPVLPAGAASALYFARQMYQFPLGVFGVALGTVLFPQLARHAERGDMKQVRDDLASGLGLSLSIGVPAGVGLMLLAEPITTLLFEHGRFTPEDGRLTSGMIAAYGASVWAFIGLLVVQRGYYACGDRVTPLRQGLIAVGVNLALDVLLLPLLGAAGLAWATSLATAFQVSLAVWQAQRHVGEFDWRGLGVLLARTSLATTAMAVVCLLLRFLASDNLADRATAVLAPLCGGMATYFGLAWLVGLKGPWRLVRGRSL